MLRAKAPSSSRTSPWSRCTVAAPSAVRFTFMRILYHQGTKAPSFEQAWYLGALVVRFRLPRGGVALAAGEVLGGGAAVAELGVAPFEGRLEALLAGHLAPLGHGRRLVGAAVHLGGHALHCARSHQLQ